MFSILIPTFNNLDYLKLCIDSIKKNSKFEHQIICSSHSEISLIRSPYYVMVKILAAAAVTAAAQDLADTFVVGPRELQDDTVDSCTDSMCPTGTNDRDARLAYLTVDLNVQRLLDESGVMSYDLLWAGCMCAPSSGAPQPSCAHA